MKTAAIYVRISKDRVGAGLGVERQEEDCRALATKLGYQVAAVFADNDISAYSGKKRPGYLSLLQAVENGQVQAVFAWHTDRLHRRPTELEPYIDASDRHDVPTFTVQAGPLNLDTPSGRMGARIHGAVASYEVEIGIERQKSAKLQAAQSGVWRGGQRPFGYEKDGMTVRESEATIIREIAERFIDGDSWRSIALDLNARGIVTANGKKWNALKVRNLAIRLRNIAVVDHNGLAQYPAQWPAVIDKSTWDRLQTAITLSLSLHKQRGPFRKHLLKGFAFCGNCGNRLNVYSGQRAGGKYEASYGCRKNDDERGVIGCGSVKRVAGAVEDLVIESLFYRLESDGLRELLSEAAVDQGELTASLSELNHAEQRLQEISALYGSGEITFDEYRSMKQTASARKDQASSAVDRLATRGSVARIPVGKTLRQAWEESDLEWRRSLLAVFIDRVVIHRVPADAPRMMYKQWRFNPDFVVIEWKA